MQPSNPIEVLAASLAHAAYQALPALDYEQIDHSALYALSAEERRRLREREDAGEKVMPRERVLRRPRMDECEVYAMFSQTWSSTALGFGGLGGQAFTSAYTCVIRAADDGSLAVYWRGRFAYLVRPGEQSDEQAQNLANDLAQQHTASRAEAAARYGARIEPDAAEA